MKISRWVALCSFALFASLAVPSTAQATSTLTGTGPDDAQTAYVLELWRNLRLSEESLASARTLMVVAKAGVAVEEMTSLLPLARPAPDRASVARQRYLDSMAVAELRSLVVRRDQSALSTYAALLGVQDVVDPIKCPTSEQGGTYRDGAQVDVCPRSVATAATPEAGSALIEAFGMLGAPYACLGAGRLGPDRFDCSSLVTIAYTRGGVPLVGGGRAPSTREMFPWDGASLASWAQPIEPEHARPGDLALYETPATHHVVMILADGYQLHTASCGDVAHIKRLRSFGAKSFSGVRRVIPPLR